MLNNAISGDVSTLSIAISGKSGCGNTTVSRMLAERLNLKFINYTFRTIAEEDGISFDEVLRLAEASPDCDRRVDTTQVHLARQAPCVLGSRLAIWMLEEADLKVYLTGSPRTRAQRILKREGGNLQRQMEATAARDKRDYARYLDMYEIDSNDYSPADLVINTNRLDAAQVVNIIEAAARSIVRKGR